MNFDIYELLNMTDLFKFTFAPTGFRADLLAGAMIRMPQYDASVVAIRVVYRDEHSAEYIVEYNSRPNGTSCYINEHDDKFEVWQRVFKKV